MKQLQINANTREFYNDSGIWYNKLDDQLILIVIANEDQRRAEKSLYALSGTTQNP